MDLETDPEAIKIPPSIEFWDYLIQLVASCPVCIDRPHNTHHPHYPEIVYPLDYGILEGTAATDSVGVDIWLGASGSHDLSAVLVTVDLHKHDTEI